MIDSSPKCPVSTPPLSVQGFTTYQSTPPTATTYNIIELVKLTTAAKDRFMVGILNIIV